MADEGTITNVAEHVFGSELDADAAIGATSIFVVDIDEFDLDGGNLTIGTDPTVLAYTVPEDSEGEITLDLPLAGPGPYSVGDPVVQSPQLVETIAWVLTPEQEEELQVRVPHTLIDALPLGSRNGGGEQVEIDYRGEEVVILDILGKPLVRDFTHGDPDTLPPPVTTDGDPPATSPVPVVRGGIGALVVQWDPIGNADPVTYEVHVSATAGFTPTYVHPTLPATTPAKTYVTDTQGALIFVRELPDGTELSYDRDYFVKVIAKDADGKAPSPHPESFGRPAQVTGDDIAVEQVLARHIGTRTITAEQLAATLVLTNLIQAPAAEGQRIEIGAWPDQAGVGVRLIAQNGTPLVVLPTNPGDPAKFVGDMEADSLTIYDLLSLRGARNVIDGGTLTLSSQLANPVSAPTVSVENDSFILNGLQPPFYQTGDHLTNRGLYFDPSGHGTGGGPSQPTLITSSLDTESFATGRIVLFEHGLNGALVEGPVTLPPLGYSWERVCGVTRSGAVVYVLAWGRVLDEQEIERELVVLRIRQLDWVALSQHPITKPPSYQVDHYRSTISSVGSSIFIWGFDSDVQGADIRRDEFTDTPWTHAGSQTYQSTTFGFDGRAGGDVIEGHIRVGSQDWISTDRDGVHGPISYDPTAGFTFQDETGFVSGPQGIAYDSNVAQFLGRAGARVSRHTGWVWTSNPAHKYLAVAYSWRDTTDPAGAPTTYDTAPSPQRLFNLRPDGPAHRAYRRNRLKISLPAFPPVGAFPSGTPRFCIYVGHTNSQAQLGSGSLHLQPETAFVTTQTASPTFLIDENDLGAVPVSWSNNFPGATSTLKSQAPAWELTGTDAKGLLALATATNSRKMAEGTVAVSVAAAQSGTAAVTFSPAFASAPRVWVSINSVNTNYIVTAQSVTTSGFTAAVQHRAGTSATATLTVAWQAIA